MLQLLMAFVIVGVLKVQLTAIWTLLSSEMPGGFEVTTNWQIIQISCVPIYISTSGWN